MFIETKGRFENLKVESAAAPRITSKLLYMDETWAFKQYTYHHFGPLVFNSII